MSITLGSNFSLGAGLPLDSRYVVADITARDAITAVYEGLLVYVVSDGQYYKYNSSAAWEVFSSGSGGGSLSTYYSESVETLDGSEFSCLDGGVIGAGTLITSFVTIDSTTPLDGSKSLAFTIPASGSGKYALLNSAAQIPVPVYAQTKKNLLTFESRFDGNAGDISLFLWDATASATIKGSDGNTLFLDPNSGVNTNQLWFETSSTANLQWGVLINNSNTGAILTIDNLQIDGSPDKEISIYASSEIDTTLPNITGLTLGNGTIEGGWSRQGEYFVYSYTVSLGSTSSVTSSLGFSLPNGYKVKGGPLYYTGGPAYFEDNNNSAARTMGVLRFSGNGSSVFLTIGGGAVNSTTPFTWSATDTLYFEGKVPIQGWSDKEDNVVVSGTNSDALDRKRYRLSVNQAIPRVTHTTVKFDTEDSRNVGGRVNVNPSTGFITVSESNWYDVSASLYWDNDPNASKHCSFINITDGTVILYEDNGKTTRSSSVSGTVFLDSSKQYAAQGYHDGLGNLNVTSVSGTNLSITYNPSYKDLILANLGGTATTNLAVYASSEWQSFTPVISAASGTVSNYTASGLFSRTGGNLNVQAVITFSAASSTFSDLKLDLPNGLSVDSTKHIVGANGYKIVGRASFADNAVANYQGDAILASSTQVSIQPPTANGAYTAQGIAGNTTPFVFNAGDTITVDFSVPILGWSDKENNVVVAGTKATYAYVEAVGSTTTTYTPSTDMEFTTVSDSRGLWNGTQFTADRDMFVDVTGSFSMTTSALREFYGRVNGANPKFMGGHTNFTNQKFQGIFKLKAGDILTFYTADTGTIDGANTSAHYLVIKELPNYEDLILAYLAESNAAVSGVERATGKSLDGKPIYEMYIKVTSDITTNIDLITGLPTGITPVGNINYTGTIYDISSTYFSGAYGQIYYTAATNKISAAVSGGYKIGAGTTVVFRYTK